MTIFGLMFLLFFVVPAHCTSVPEQVHTSCELLKSQLQNGKQTTNGDQESGVEGRGRVESGELFQRSDKY